VVIPAGVLIANEKLHIVDQVVEGFLGSQAIRTALFVSVFNPLQHSGDANLHELIEIAGGYGQELYSLQQRIGGILGFLQDTPVEAHP
jgi:hypothetical protein